MPDPKLKAAMEEIKVILQKHDIGALVMLSSQEHMEYLNHLHPSWSCIHVNGDEIRVRCKHEDFESKAAQKKCLEDSLGMLAGFNDIMTKMQEGFLGLLKIIGSQMEITHRTWKDTG